MELLGKTGRVRAGALDVRESTVSQWRKGDVMPDDQNLASLARELTVTPQWLRYGDEPATETPAGDAISPLELRGYAIAVRDMLASAQAAQQRLIDGLAKLGSTPLPAGLTREEVAEDVRIANEIDDSKLSADGVRKAIGKARTPEAALTNVLVAAQRSEKTGNTATGSTPRDRKRASG